MSPLQQFRMPRALRICWGELITMSFGDTSLQLEATDRMLAKAGELAAAGKLAEAVSLYHESLKNIVNLYGARSLKACLCLLDLADIYYHLEQYAEVITLLEQVLVTSQSEEIFSDEKLLSIKFKLGKALEKSGNLRQACQCYAEVLNGANVICGPASPFTKTVAECLRLLSKRTGGALQIEGLDSRPAQSQTGQLAISQGSARNQYDTSQLERLRQSVSRSLPEVSSQSAEAHENPAELQTRKFVREVPNARTYEARTMSAPILLQRYLRAVITVPVACLLVVWLFFSGVLNDKDSMRLSKSKESVASATAALNPTSLAEYAGLYSSTDGVKRFEVQDGGKGILFLGTDAEEVKISKLAGELYAESEGVRVVFRAAGNSLVDENGTKLFKRGTPELGVVAAAHKLADDFNRYYARYGKYPRSQMSLQTAGISYSNALTLRPTQPKLMSVSSDQASSSMTLSDYQNANWMAANLMAMNGAMGEPGGIEVHVFPVSSVGETVFIRGFDREGQLLPSSTTGKCFTVVLVSGAVSR